MSLLKLIAIIVLIWFIVQIRKFISSIQITKNNPQNKGSNGKRKSAMDIQDADYEEVD